MIVLHYNSLREDVRTWLCRRDGTLTIFRSTHLLWILIDKTSVVVLLAVQVIKCVAQVYP
jgi:hypothetical protein